MSFDAEEFIRAQTVLQAPSLLPGIKLHLATEVTPLWQMTEEKMQETNLPPPFWAFAWPGGQGLARYVLDHPETVRGKRVLDFASGGGVTAIAAHKAGASRVMASDIDPLAQAALRMNAAANGVVIEDVGVLEMNRVFKRADMILAGDVCYQQAMSTAVVRWLRLCREAGMRVLMGDPGRAWLPQEGLKKLAEYEVPTSLELEDRESRTAVVWEFLAP